MTIIKVDDTLKKKKKKRKRKKKEKVGFELKKIEILKLDVIIKDCGMEQTWMMKFFKYL